MRLTQLQTIDLNLLITFAVIAEEKSISAAATRLLRSQPAITRALQRARIALQDDLLVRSSIGFEPTLRGRKILQELERLLPRLEDMMEPRAFDPQTGSSHFRLCGPDNICAEIIPALCRKHSVEDYLVTFDFAPWSSDALDALEKGKLDLVLSIDDGLLPSHFQSEKLAREEWVCVVARNSKFGNSFTLKQYLSAAHLVVGTLPGVQTIPDKQLNALGVKRRFSVRLPYFGAALNCLFGTNLVLTLTSGMSDLATCNSRLRLVQAPRQLEGFHFLMVWHPRANSDARHQWLRQAVRNAASR
jgi:DNA-binding transcriptional LysR family regulator